MTDTLAEFAAASEEELDQQQLAQQLLAQAKEQMEGPTRSAEVMHSSCRTASSVGAPEPGSGAVPRRDPDGRA